MIAQETVFPSGGVSPNGVGFVPRPPPTRLSPGSGVIQLRGPSYAVASTSAAPTTSSSSNVGSTGGQGRARFASLSAAYPLKLLCPSPLPSQPAGLAVMYTLAYGGGLVAGDIISLRGEVGQGCGLVMLTQGSTKVYKRRPGIRPMSHSQRQKKPQPALAQSTGSDDWHKPETSGSALTRQRMHITLASNALLLVLPDSISPFARSQYSQVQRFILPEDGTASALILDWVNSGRGQQDPRAGTAAQGQASQGIQGRGEEIWSMESYGSTNEVFVGDRLIMRERMVLDNFLSTPNHARPNATAPATDSLTRVAKHLAPYNIYATILFLGPAFSPLLKHLQSWSDKTRQFQLKDTPGLVWSFSEVDPVTGGGVVRVAAEEVESARLWIRAMLDAGQVSQLVGEGLWPRII
ncbi:hypothetical protein IAU60_003370 [Kwoniella sp. DSM 27419]